jgi:hypothetical protein
MEPTSSTAGLVLLAKSYGATMLGVLLAGLTNRGRTLTEHGTAVVAGVAFSIYLVPALAEYFGIKSTTALNGMYCLGALFALNIVQAVSAQIAPAMQGLREKLTGPSAPKGE